MYRLVFNRALGVTQAVAEIATRQQGGVAASKAVPSSPRHALLALCIGGALLGFSGASFAQLVPGYYNGGYSPNGGGAGGTGTGSQGGGAGGNYAGGGMIVDGNGAAGSMGGSQDELPGGAGGNATLVLTSTNQYAQSDVSGGAGGNGARSSGGGGGGAAIYIASDTAPTYTAINAGVAVTGGNGGAGGQGDLDVSGGGGGGGGAALAMGDNTDMTNSGTLVGGTGGTAGYNAGAGGGGAGALLFGTNGFLNNYGSITGGTGGAPYSNYDSAGGGIGVTITGNNNVFINQGSVAGGWNATHDSQAAAIAVYGSGNYVSVIGGSTVDGAIIAQGEDLSSNNDNTFQVEGGGVTNSLVLGFNTVRALNNTSWSFSGPLVSYGDMSVYVAGGSSMVVNGPLIAESPFLPNVMTAAPTTGSGLTKSGDGTLEVMAPIYTGTTTVDGGTLILHNGPAAAYNINDGVLDNAGGALTVTSLSGYGKIVNTTDLTINSSGNGTFQGDITADTLTLTQPLPFVMAGNLTAGVALQQGALQLGDGGTTGTFTGNASGTGSLAFNRSDAVTYSGDAAVNQLAQLGSGVLTLTGNNSADLIDIDAGTLRAASAGALGHGIVSMFDGSTFAFGGSQTFANTFVLRGDVSFDVADGETGTLTGALPDGINGSSVTKVGLGTLVIDTELQSVDINKLDQGTVVLGSVAGNGAKVDSGFIANAGTTVGGFGNFVGGLGVIGGTIAPGMGQIGVLSAGALGLANATLDIDLGTPGSSDRIDVAGDADFTNSVVNINDLGGMGMGVYRILTIGGTLHTNELSLGSTPTGSNLQLRYLADENEFDIVNLGNLTLNYWNADGLASATHAGGGTGTWSATAPMFSDATGNVTDAMNPQPGFAVFGGGAGKVTVDGSEGAISVRGMQFMTDGYWMVGDAIQLVGSDGAAPIIRVGDGTAEGASMFAAVDNVLTGTDGLEKSDAGTLLLRGDNTFTGGVTVSGGTLEIMADKNLGDATNAITLKGGTLYVPVAGATQRNFTLGKGDGNVMVDATYDVAGAISGTGALHKSGDGALSLSGDNSYAGGTWLDAGTLVAASNNALGTGIVHMAENTVLGFGRDGMNVANGIVVSGDPTLDVAAGTTATLSGAIVDGAMPGDIVKTGDGSLRLTAANTYTGGTTVAQGALIVGDGATAGSIVGNVVVNNAGTLAFDRSDAVTFAGAISGDGTVSKLGGNTLNLTGDSSAFTGTTQVAGGVLNLSGSLGGSLVLAQGAVLTGAGKLGQVTVASGSNMTPGGDDAIGRFDVAGDLAFANGATYVVNTAADGTSDTVAATGTATLGGATVRSLQGTGTYKASTRYTILTADGGVQGTFGALTSNLAFLTPTLSYDANHVYLDLLRNDTSFRSLAVNANQAATADAIESQGSGVSVYDAVVALQAADVPPALGQLAGVSLASARTAMVDDARQVRETVQHHLLGTNDGGQAANGAWASAWGHWGDRDGSAGVDRLRSNGGGLLVGADRDLGGVTLGGTVGTGTLTARSGSDSVQGHSRVAGLYAAGAVGAWEWQAGAMYGWNRLDSHRRVNVEGLAGSTSARYDATTAQAYVDGGYRFTFAQGSLTPFVNVARVQLDQDGIHERNSDAALDVQGQDDGVTLGTAGVRGTLALGEGISAHATLAYQQAWGDVRPYDTQRFAAGGDSFTVAGAPLARHAGLADAGFTFAVARNTTVSASYHGLFGGGAKDQGARMALEVKW